MTEDILQMTEQESGEEKEDLEALFTDLEAILREMESGNPTLERSMDLYHTGMKKLALCHEKIDLAEKQLIILQNRPEDSDV